jgi:hypothetical protein
MDLTHIRPNPSNYAQYIEQRKTRTEKAMAASNRISGRQILEENLSVRMLYDAGYEYDVVADIMVKENGK